MRIKIIAITIFILSLSLNVNGWFSFNSGGNAFQNQSEEGTKASETLDKMLITAAGYLLQSHSDYKYFLKKLELSINGINYYELQNVLNKTISNMEYANSRYFEIWELSKTLEYNPTVIEKLKNFDYAEYKANNNLIPSIFVTVESFLINGNVRGVFEKAYADTGIILEKLKAIKTQIDANTIPETTKIWRLNQSFIEFDLFGQYISEVFIKIEFGDT
jgi:hypothetical protein